MNSLPSLPTDNLYKFCALLGAAIITLAFYTTWSRIGELQRTIIRLDKEIAINEAEHDAMRSTEPAFKTATGELPSFSASDNLGDLKLKLEQAEKTVHALKEHANEWKALFMKTAELTAGLREVLLSTRELRVVKWAGGVGSVIGLIISIYGFTNWRRIQKQQDKLLFTEGSAVGV